jgi:hypothetical protein
LEQLFRLILAMNNTAKTTIDVQYKNVHAQMMAEMNVEHLEPLNTEDEILTAAIKICKTRKKRVD